MSSNTENIEAKLCAYVDGDLDEHGKLEIEKHLQANPQHRLLLEELKQTKVMMQALPREVAPPELAETIHGQLERSVLLDGVGTEDVAATMKINRWPQLMAVAAVLILATGLGVLVYVVLPKHTDVAFDPVASTRPETADKRLDAMKAKESTEFGPVAGKDSAGARFPEERQPEGLKETEAFAKNEAKFGVAGGGGGVGGLTLNGLKGDASVAANLNKTGEVQTASARRVLIVLKTDNVAETNGQVATYLESNKISWSAAEPSVRDVYLTSRFRNTNVQLREQMADAKIAGVVPPAAPLANSTINNGAQVAGSDNNFNTNALNSNNERNYGSSKVAAKGGNYDSNYNRDAYQAPPPGRAGNDVLQSQQQAAMPMPQTPPGQSQQVAEPNVAQQAQQEKQSLTLNQQANEAIAQGERRFNLEPASNENVIVARNLSREQATMVVDSLGKLYAGQTAVVLDRDVLDDYPAKHLPDADQVLATSTTQPSTQPAAVDQQTGWGQASVARAGGEASKPLDEAAPTTLPVGTAPPAPELAATTTQPVDGAALGEGVSLPVFSPKQAQDLDLKAQAITTQPAELPLEVVIVVQPAAVTPPAMPVVAQPNSGATTEPAVSATPSPAPATQPGAVEPAPADAAQNAK